MHVDKGISARIYGVFAIFLQMAQVLYEELKCLRLGYSFDFAFYPDCTFDDFDKAYPYV